MRKILHIPRTLAIAIVRMYQWLLSPDHSFWAKHIYPHGYCKFNPSCSNYTVDAFKKYGLIRGSVKGMWRIIRCNPWTSGGEDKA